MAASQGASRRGFANAVHLMRTRWPELNDAAPDDSPVFVLAAGWRSGSTLLQRMLMPECMIWGEPYGHACMLEHLAEPLRCMTNDWPEPHFFLNDSNRDSVTERFIANMYPSVKSLVEAHRAYFATLFKYPAKVDGGEALGRDPAYERHEAGTDRWGFKEVRLSADYAHYLKLLYPDSKFLFLIRNPYDAYRSWAARRNADWKWFYRWPDQPVTARLFGRLWCELAGSFIDQAETLDAHGVRYEDLKAENYEPIEAYLGFSLNHDAAKIRPNDGPKPIEAIPNAEFAELGDAMHEMAESLGYSNDAKNVAVTRHPVEEQNDGPGNPSYDGSRSKVDMDTARCVVLVPVGGSIVPACEEALAELERRGYPVRRVRGYSAIDQGRNQMATNAMADGFEETMWIDSDVGFDPDDVDKLRQHDVPIACGIYPQKGRRVLACHVLPGTDKLIFGDEGGLTEILYAGTGFLLVRREAYETIHCELQLPLCNERFGGRPMVPYFQPMSHAEQVESEATSHWYLAEDFAFCERARQAGFKIYADTSVRLMHYGNYGYSWEDAGMELQRFRTFHFHTK